MEIIALLALTVFVGALIGAIGIGGVLLVPALSLFMAVDVKIAIASCLLAFLFAGVHGAWLYSRRGAIDWPAVGWVCLGAFPGAFVGVWLLELLSATFLLLMIAGLMVSSGVYALIPQRDGAADKRISKPLLVVFAGVTGIVSALTGTGGPVTLIPLLMFVRAPILWSVGLGLVAQVPISLAASTGNLMLGLVDWTLVGIIVPAMALGVWFGARMAQQLPAEKVKMGAAIFLIGFGLLIGGRVIF